MRIFTDGASRGNPGPAAIGYIFVINSKQWHSGSKFIGRNTNNQAEYLAIVEALKEARKFTKGKIKLYSDSELVINQINRDYQIKKDHLSQLCRKVHELVVMFEKVSFYYVTRENQFIRQADSLCNECLNDYIGNSAI